MRGTEDVTAAVLHVDEQNLVLLLFDMKKPQILIF